MRIACRVVCIQEFDLMSEIGGQGQTDSRQIGIADLNAEGAPQG